MTIKPGDLVMVVRDSDACSCPSNAVGLIRTVIAIEPPSRGVCSSCRKTYPHTGPIAVLDGPAPWRQWGIELSRLKKIPPLREPEIIEERLAVKA